MWKMLKSKGAKRLLAVTLAAALMLGSGAGASFAMEVAGGGEGNPPADGEVPITEIDAGSHVHTWSETGETVKEATCTVAGEETYTCTVEGCTEQKTEAIPATGQHNDGDSDGKCDACGAHDHTWSETGETVKEPTCTVAGEKTYTCTVKGCTEQKTEAIPATGQHNDGDSDGKCDIGGEAMMSEVPEPELSAEAKAFVTAVKSLTDLVEKRVAWRKSAAAGSKARTGAAPEPAASEDEAQPPVAAEELLSAYKNTENLYRELSDDEKKLEDVGKAQETWVTTRPEAFIAAVEKVSALRKESEAAGTKPSEAAIKAALNEANALYNTLTETQRENAEIRAAKEKLDNPADIISAQGGLNEAAKGLTEAAQKFLAAVEALSKLAKEKAAADEAKEAPTFAAYQGIVIAYGEAQALYDGLSEDERLFDETVAAKAALEEVAQVLEIERLTKIVKDVEPFLAAIGKLNELQADDAPAEEAMAAYEEALSLYDALSDEEKALEEVAAMKGLLDSNTMADTVEEPAASTVIEIHDHGTDYIKRYDFDVCKTCYGKDWGGCGDDGNANYGKSGSNVQWTLVPVAANKFKLVIYGDGKIKDYTGDDRAAWFSRSELSKIEEVEIQDGVEKIGSYMFSENNSSAMSALTKVTIPDSVTEIGKGAFKNCKLLTTLALSKVKKIGSDAFNGCSGLTSVTLGDQLSEIYGGTFSGCTSLTEITIPNSVTTIGASAFKDLKLSTVTFIPGNNLTEIGSNAFENCTNLTGITIPNSVEKIGASAFKGSGLGKNSGTVTLGSGLTEIGASAFENCTSLTGITIPSSVKKIGNSAFKKCSTLGTVTFGQGSNLTEITAEAFSGCASLTKIEIPDKVTNIGNSLFYDCTNLSSVTLGNGLTKISSYMFYNCTNLTGITIPNSVTSMGANAFENSGLTSITVPDSVTTWDPNGSVFSGCKSLVSAKLPTNITTIVPSLFSDCTKLNQVNFTDCKELTTIYAHAFQNTALTYVNLSKTKVNTIVEFAFSACSQLKKIVLPTTLGQEDTNGVYGGRGLQNSVFPSSLQELVFTSPAPPFGNAASAGSKVIIQIPINEDLKILVPANELENYKNLFNSLENDGNNRAADKIVTDADDIHKQGDSWEWDDTDHWKLCVLKEVCTDKLDKASHESSGWGANLPSEITEPPNIQKTASKSGDQQTFVDWTESNRNNYLYCQTCGYAKPKTSTPTPPGGDTLTLAPKSSNRISLKAGGVVFSSTSDDATISYHYAYVKKGDSLPTDDTIAANTQTVTLSGEKKGTIECADLADPGEYDVRIVAVKDGTVLASLDMIVPPYLNFGEQPKETASEEKTVTIPAGWNVEEAPAVEVTTKPNGATDNPFTVTTGNGKEEVTFNPGKEGEYSGNIVITVKKDGNTMTITVPVIGTGTTGTTTAGEAKLTVTGPVFEDGKAVAKPITIANGSDATATATITDVALASKDSSNNNDLFEIANTITNLPNPTVAANGSNTQWTIKPKNDLAPGTYTYVINVTYTDGTTNTDGTLMVKTEPKTVTFTVPSTPVPVLTPVASNRTDKNEGDVKFTSDMAGNYYYKLVKRGEPAPGSVSGYTPGGSCDAGGTGNPISFNDLKNLVGAPDYNGEYDVWIMVKTADNRESSPLKIEIPPYVDFGQQTVSTTSAAKAVKVPVPALPAGATGVSYSVGIAGTNGTTGGVFKVTNGNGNNLSQDLNVTFTPDVTGGRTATMTVTGTYTVTENGTAVTKTVTMTIPLTGTGTDQPVLTPVSSKRETETKGEVTFTSSKGGAEYHYVVVKKGETPPTEDAIKDSTNQGICNSADGGNTTISRSDLKDSAGNVNLGEYEVYIKAKDENGNWSDTLKMEIPPYVNFGEQTVGTEKDKTINKPGTLDPSKGITATVKDDPDKAFEVKVKPDGTITVTFKPTTPDKTYNGEVEIKGKDENGKDVTVTVPVIGKGVKDTELKPVSANRTGKETGDVTFQSTKTGEYYYVAVKKGDTAPTKQQILDAGKKGDCKADTAQKIDMSNLADPGEYEVYIVVKTEDGGTNGEPLRMEVPPYVRLDFGNVPKDDADGKKMSVKIPDGWTGVSVTGPTDTTFTKTDVVGAAGAVTSVDVTFKPTEVKTYGTAEKPVTLTISGTKDGIPVTMTVELTGTGITGEAKLATTGPKFEDGKSDTPKPITIKNDPTATATATIKDVVLTGTGNDNDKFEITNTGSPDPAVTVGGSNTQWTIKPKADLPPGTYTYEITVTYTDGAKGADGQPLTKTVVEKVTFTVTDAPVLKPVSSNRTDKTTGDVTFQSTKTGEYYYVAVKKGDTVPTKQQILDAGKKGDCTADTDQKIDLSNLADPGEYEVYIVVKTPDGKESSILKMVVPPYVDFGRKTVGVPTEKEVPLPGRPADGTAPVISGSSNYTAKIEDGKLIVTFKPGAVGGSNAKVQVTIVDESGNRVVMTIPVTGTGISGGSTTPTSPGSPTITPTTPTVTPTTPAVTPTTPAVTPTTPTTPAVTPTTPTTTTPTTEQPTTQPTTTLTEKPAEKPTDTLKPAPPVDPDAKPITDSGYEYPTYRNVTPDPNDPASPEIIVVLDEEDVPTVYRKTDDPENPGKMIYVEDPTVPLAGPAAMGYWALLNLLLAIVTVLGGIFVVIKTIRRNRREEEDEKRGRDVDFEEYEEEDEEDEKEEEEKRRKWYILNVLAAIVSVVVFILTEDMSLPMRFVDRWTLLMAILALLEVPGLLSGRKRKEKPERREECTQG